MGMRRLSQRLRERREFGKWRKRGWLDMAPSEVKWSVLRHRGIPGAPWIETGTYRGRTTEMLAAFAPSVTTLEPAPVLYERAVETLAGLPNVTVLNGTSEDLFPDLLAKVSGDMNFWLDGHYSGGKTFQGSTDCPIPQELAAISANLDHMGDVAILIDDVREFLPGTSSSPDYPPLDDLVDWARGHDMNWRIEHDIFIATRRRSAKPA